VLCFLFFLQALPETLGSIHGLQVLQASGNPGLMLPLTLTALTSLSTLSLSFCRSNAGELLESAPEAFAGNLQVGAGDVAYPAAQMMMLHHLRHQLLLLCALTLHPCTHRRPALSLEKYTLHVSLS
jgi:hypothetical protein